MQGASPITYVFEPEDLPGRSLVTVVYPGTPGIVVDQDVHITGIAHSR